MWQNAKRRVIDEAEFDRMAMVCVVEESTIPEVLAMLRGSGLNYETFMSRVRFFTAVARSEM